MNMFCPPVRPFRRLLLLVIATGLPQALDAAAPQPIQFAIYPERISLNSAGDRQGIVIQARFADGSTRDIAERSQAQVAGAAARLNGTVLEPAADGMAELRVEFEGLFRSVPIEVTGANAETPVRFRNDVLPILTRSGCNTGRCHGSASGKDGFRLSLFGYDPQGDHYRLTREIPGRRINLADPEESLLVNKALGKVPHSGGQRLQAESVHYRVLLTWLDAGAPPDPADVPRPVGIAVYPPRAVFSVPEQHQRIVVLARYSDGTDRDVTDLAVFLSNNDAAATVSQQGLVKGTGPGNAFILARFDQFTEGSSIIVRPGTPYEFPQVPARNEIDELVYARWREMHLVPSGICSDETFLRRAFIDLIGRLPSPQQRREFLGDMHPEKRARLVDALLEREEFRDIWIMKWADVLQIRTNNGVSPKGLKLYDQWLRDRVHDGVTIDKIVQEVVSATGGTFENPATSYFQTETTPQLLAENVAQAFLGTRIQCAQCHNHPFDRWTMDDYYGFAAFFSQVGYKQAQDPREITVFNSGIGEMKHPLGGRAVPPRFLAGGNPSLSPGEDYRRALADWLVSPENTALPRHLANVVWAHFLGVGVVEPVDDERVSNPPSNPALLAALGQRLQDADFDIKPLIREICNSRTYQLATQRNASNSLDERNFSHGRVRRMRAEVLLDCLSQVTEAQDMFAGLPAGGRAVQVADGRTPNYFLTTFGRATRQTPCACEVRTSPTLSQALHLINGETTSGKIEEGGVVQKLLAELHEPLEVAGELYERCLCRRPTDRETSAIAGRLNSSTDVPAALTDLFWGLLNSNEFIFNH
jgi:hypothetical protein